MIESRLNRNQTTTSRREHVVKVINQIMTIEVSALLEKKRDYTEHNQLVSTKIYLSDFSINY